MIKDSSSVARMLSSPDTLIFMCMRKEKYERAYQVLPDNATAGQATAVVASMICSLVEHMIVRLVGWLVGWFTDCLTVSLNE